MKMSLKLVAAAAAVASAFALSACGDKKEAAPAKPATPQPLPLSPRQLNP